ncbi:F-box/kelch-repeat protein At3g06240-like [Papaver somniferum]|uniref:F-box/kelch-repeat protein At3g06240-like n=1 Tax=Papaver somniferum TaxID=3469 RepID=UPI000E6FF304|nr:F-box/kelch-repeat protein At3g06240-like [Papaver somniferum]
MSSPLQSSERYEGYDVVRIDYPFISFRWKKDVELLGHCNGLIYCLDNTRRLSCLWNPATKEYKIIPKLQLGSDLVEVDSGTWWIDPPLSQEHTENTTICLHAFGYDCKIGDYKVICVEYLSGIKDGCLIHVYTLGTNSWTSSQTELEMVPVSPQNGVLVNGLLHWLGIKHGKKVIMSLDLNSERFNELEPPKEALENSLITVEALEGFLCVLVEVFQVQFEVWVMRDYGVRESWTRRYIHDDIGTLKLSGINVRENTIKSFSKVMWFFGEILLWDGYRTVFHDLKHLTERKLSTYINFSNLVVNYFESLVSVKSGIYVGENQEDEEE